MAKSTARLLSGVILLVISGIGHAQQPGSAQYNSVYLPAHGVGDTQRGPSPRDRYGALALSDADKWTGWVLDERSEASARESALRKCRERGGRDCRIEFTFWNSCAAFAQNGVRGMYATGGSLRDMRRKALKACGDDCEVLIEGCALPARR